MVEVKICGITDKESAKVALEAGASYIGFIFFSRSPRNITPALASEIANSVSSIKKVAVIVDASNEEIENILKDFSPNYLQLHGSESPKRVKEIKEKFSLPVIKAFSVSSGDDIAASGRYEGIADMFLFDAKAPDNMVDALPGGNGVSFNWALLKSKNFDTDWMLSGGLNASNIKEAIDISGAKIIDASSSLEILPGKKSPELIKEFLKAI